MANNLPPFKSRYECAVLSVIMLSLGAFGYFNLCSARRADHFFYVFFKWSMLSIRISAVRTPRYSTRVVTKEVVRFVLRKILLSCCQRWKLFMELPYLLLNLGLRLHLLPPYQNQTDWAYCEPFLLSLLSEA